MLEYVDLDKDGTIGFAEFLIMMFNFYTDYKLEDQMKAVFDTFDTSVPPSEPPSSARLGCLWRHNTNKQAGIEDKERGSRTL